MRDATHEEKRLGIAGHAALLRDVFLVALRMIDVAALLKNLYRGPFEVPMQDDVVLQRNYRRPPDRESGLIPVSVESAAGIGSNNAWGQQSFSTLTQWHMV